MEFRKAGKPVLLYFSSAPVSPERLDTEQYRALTEYRKELAQEGLFFTYTSTTMLRDLLTTHIARVFAELPASHADAAPDGDHAMECAYDWYNEIGYRDTSELVPGTRVLYEEHALFPEMDEEYYAQYRRIRIPENPFATSPRGFVKIDARSLEWHDPRKRDRRIYETTLRDPVQLPRSCVVDILPVELETGED
jgi:hypothetical protein